MGNGLQSAVLASCMTVASGCTSPVEANNNTPVQNTEKSHEIVLAERDLTKNHVNSICAVNNKTGEQIRILKSGVEISSLPILPKELEDFCSGLKDSVSQIENTLNLGKEVTLIRSLEVLSSVNDGSLDDALDKEQLAKIRLKSDLSNFEEVADFLFDNADDYKNALKVLGQIKKYLTPKATKENPNPKSAPYLPEALENFVTLFNHSLDNSPTGTVKREIARRNLNNSLAIVQYSSVNSDVFNKNEKYYSKIAFTEFMSKLTDYLMTTTKSKEGDIALKVEIGFKEESYTYSFPTQSWINELPIQSPNLDNALKLSLSYLRNGDSFGKLMNLAYSNILAGRELAGKEEELAGKEEELAGKEEELAGKEEELAGKEEELAGNTLISGLLKKANSEFENGKYKSAKDLYSQIMNSNVNVSPSVRENIDNIKEILKNL